MHSLGFGLAYRPLRIGWCLRNGDVAALRRTLRQNYTLWGGTRNPLVVIDDRDAASKLIENASVDVLLSLDEEADEDLHKFTESFPHLPRVGFWRGEKHLFRESPDGTSEPLILDIGTAARAQLEAWRQAPAPEGTRYRAVRWDDDDPLAPILVSLFGELPRAGEDGSDFARDLMSILDFEVNDMTGRGPLPDPSAWWHTLRSLSLHGLELYLHDRPWDGRSVGCFVGSIESHADLVDFWNLRAAGHGLAFYDPVHAERLRPFCEGWINGITKLQADARRAPSITIFRRPRANGVDLSWVPTRFHEHALDDDIPACPRIPLWYFPEQSALANVGPYKQTLRATIPLPKPPFHEERYSHRRYAVVLAAKYPLGLDETLTFTTPLVPQLNTFYGTRFHGAWYGSRVERRGLAVIDDMLGDISVSALRVSELFQNLFKVHGIKAELSKAGLVTSRVIAQMGGVDSCRVFRIKGLRTLIERTRPEGSFTRSHAIQAIREAQADGSIGFDRYKDLVIEYREERDHLTPDDVFRFMLERGAFRVGLEFRCTQCSLEQWVSLDNVKTLMECEYCGKRFDVSAQLKDRDWRYRRSGVFGKSDSQEGAIPVTLTLLRFWNMLNHVGLLYVPSLSLSPLEAQIPECETDFAFLGHGRTGGEEHLSLAIGECKTRGDITGQDVENLKAVANAFEARDIRTFIVFTKLADFSPEEIELIRTVNDNDRSRAIILTPEHLEPWRAYQNVGRGPKQSISAHDLPSFAAATRATFFARRENPG